MHQLSMEISDYYTGKDHFMVEDLFNFSNDEAALDGAEDNVAFGAVNGDSTDSSSTVTPGNCDGFSASGYGQHFSTDFYQPCEEVAELEWLSNFMEDCFSNKDHPKPPYQFSNAANPSSSDSAQFASSASNQVPAKSARSKRSRANPTNWASRIPILTPSESAPRSRNSTEASLEGCRRCLHCGSDQTPQWRMGPMGPKTLCNACGVRYKSGRLVPEYRPAASPTFVMSEHSNSHRKVVELRRQKELVEKQQQMLFWS